MGLSVLPTRRASWRCVGTVLESLMTPLLLLWSCVAQYAVVLPTTLRGMTPRAAPVVSASSSSPPSSGDPSGGTDVTAATTATEDILVWARHPVLWAVLGGTLYGAFFVLAAAHYLRVVSVDNCPEVHPHDDEAAPQPGGDEEDQEEARGLAGAGEPVPRCPKCGGPKPERCHHCSACRRCCLKMDHHCPWMGNCIGFYNYKFFVNFLGWTALLCTLVIVEAAPYFLVFLRASSTTAANYIQALHITILGCGLFPNLPSMHFIPSSVLTCVFPSNSGCCNAPLRPAAARVAHRLRPRQCHNPRISRRRLSSLTTCLLTHEFHLTFLSHPKQQECCAKQTMYGPYDLGRRRNWLQVYGPRPLLWFLPVFTSLGDGYTYPRSPNYVPPSPSGTSHHHHHHHDKDSTSDTDTESE